MPAAAEAVRPIAPAEGVTTVVSRIPKPGCAEALEHWTSDAIHTFARFPGHQGATVLRPRPGQPELVLVFRFASAEDLQRWSDSPECKALLKRVEPLSEGPARLERQTGLETWFTLPGQPQVRPPPPWKMALVTWATLWPLILVVGTALKPLTDPLPLLLRPGANAAVMVVLMTWVVMPRVTRLLRPFLFR